MRTTGALVRKQETGGEAQESTESERGAELVFGGVGLLYKM
jgi:hypothetical protein